MRRVVYAKRKPLLCRRHKSGLYFAVMATLAHRANLRCAFCMKRLEGGLATAFSFYLFAGAAALFVSVFLSSDFGGAVAATTGVAWPLTTFHPPLVLRKKSVARTSSA